MIINLHPRLLLFCSLLSIIAVAQDSSIKLSPRVIDVYNPKFANDKEKRQHASIGDLIAVRVSNLDSLIKEARCKDKEGKDIPNCKQKEIRLFINGRMMKGIVPEDGAPQRVPKSDNGELQFRLDRNAENDKIWADILGAPPFNKGAFNVPVNVSVGFENDYAFPSTDNGTPNFNFQRIHEGWFWFCFGGIIVYLISLFFLVKYWGLLRDRVPDLRFTEIQNPDDPSGQFPAPPLNLQYSLGRFQMAFWFSLVIMSFLFIWLITDAYDIITPSILGLIGISVGTSLSAAVIDDSKDRALIEETKVLQQKQADAATTPTEKAQLLDKIRGNIRQLKPKESQGFLKDILEDANGISFHRLQMLVWTVVLGVLFVYTVWKKLSMPDFDATLLALQGLTAGTYLGFKFPEKQS